MARVKLRISDDGTTLLRVPSTVKRITVPEGVKTIRVDAFRDCAELRAVALPSTLVAIDADVFSFSRQMRTIKYDPKAAQVVQSAFLGMKYRLSERDGAKTKTNNEENSKERAAKRRVSTGRKSSSMGKNKKGKSRLDFDDESLYSDSGNYYADEDSDSDNKKDKKRNRKSRLDFDYDSYEDYADYGSDENKETESDDDDSYEDYDYYGYGGNKETEQSYEDYADYGSDENKETESDDEDPNEDDEEIEEIDSDDADLNEADEESAPQPSNAVDWTDRGLEFDPAYQEKAAGVYTDCFGAKLVSYSTSRTDAAYTIPGGVLIVGSNSFANAEALVVVTIPASVQAIESGAFSGCGNLRVAIFEGRPEIARGAFAKTPSLRFVVCGSGDRDFFAQSFPNLRSTAFIDREQYDRDCELENSVQDGPFTLSKSKKKLLKYAAECASEHCEIPNGVESIEPGAFAGASRLRSIACPGSLKRIGSGAFQDCSELATVALPKDGVEIGERAFKGCVKLAAISLADCRYVGARAFEGCDSLAAIDWPVCVPLVPEGIFAGCAALESVSLPKGVVAIAPDAFRDCVALRDVLLPESLAVVGARAFQGCKNLRATSKEETDLRKFSEAEEEETELRKVPEFCAFLEQERESLEENLKKSSSYFDVTNSEFYGRALVDKVRRGEAKSKLRLARLPKNVRVVGKDAFAQTGLQTTTKLIMPGWLRNLFDVLTLGFFFKR